MSAGNGSGDASHRHKKRKLEQRAMGEQTERTAAQPDGAVDVTVPSTEVVNGFPPRNDHQLIQQLLEPFSREQLLELLTSAATQHDDVLHEIKAIANADVAHRKVFVRGLAWETTSERLTAAFAIFGEVEEGAVIYEKATGKSRGYGFVTFADMDGAQRAVERQVIEIDGRRASCNIAAVRGQVDDQQHHHHGSALHYQQGHPPPHLRAGHSPVSGGPYTVYTTNMQPPPQAVGYGPPAMLDPARGAQGDEAERKLFVRGLSWDTMDDSLHAEFAKYGELVEATVVRDRKTGKSKGFGFVTFQHRGAAATALQQPQKVIDGRSVTCNLASLGRTSLGAPSPARPGSSGGPYMAPPPGYPASVQPDPYSMYQAPSAVDPYRQSAYGYGTAPPNYNQPHPHQYYAPPPPGPVATTQAMHRQ